MVCRFLRNKKMYVPGQQLVAFDEAPDPNGIIHCWCNRTMSDLGVDDELVSFEDCSEPTRICYEE